MECLSVLFSLILLTAHATLPSDFPPPILPSAASKSREARIVTVRAAGGQYSSWLSMLQGEFPGGVLQHDLEIRFEGGREWNTQGSSGGRALGHWTDNDGAAWHTTDWNNHQVTLTTDPADLPEPATLLAKIIGYTYAPEKNTHGRLKVKNLKYGGHESCGAVLGMPVWDGNFRHGIRVEIDNCLIADIQKPGESATPFLGSEAFADSGCPNTMTHCTVALTWKGAEEDIVLNLKTPDQYGAFKFRNNLILCYLHGDRKVVIESDKTDNNGNTFYNYGPGKLSLAFIGGGGGKDNIVGQNPNLQSHDFIRACDESPELILRRNAALTSKSLPCLKNGSDLLPADITGAERRKGAASDRGAYKYGAGSPVYQ